MRKTLFVLDDSPCGSERSYEALRLAGSLAKRQGEQAKLFRIGMAASRAESHQEVPQGYHMRADEELVS